ncbi:MAG: hypothetical protein IKT43_02045 [Clostridia bacterium]|nr:hypothetical protein [Clostridia bacterium]
MEFFESVWNGIVTAWHAVRGFLFSLFYEQYLLQVVLVLLIVTWPWIVRVLRRATYMHRVRGVCKQKGFSFTRHRATYLLGNYNSRECEFSVVTKTRAFAVKLVTTRSKNQHLRFLDATNLELVKNAGLLFGSPVSLTRRRARRLPASVRWKPHPDWEFFTYAERDLPTERVVLCLPEPKVVTFRRRLEDVYSNRFEIVRLHDGDSFHDCVYHNGEGFLNKLENIREGYTLHVE